MAGSQWFIVLTDTLQFIDDEAGVDEESSTYSEDDFGTFAKLRRALSPF